jgi:hypothetical protein
MPKFVATVEFSIEAISDRPGSDRDEGPDIANALKTELQLAIEKSVPDIQSAIRAGLRAQQESVRVIEFDAEVIGVESDE